MTWVERSWAYSTGWLKCFNKNGLIVKTVTSQFFTLLSKAIKFIPPYFLIFCRFNFVWVWTMGFPKFFFLNIKTETKWDDILHVKGRLLTAINPLTYG